MDALHLRTAQYFTVWDLVLPLHMEQSPETSHMEGIELLGVTAVHCPCFTAIEQRGEDHCAVYLELCSEAETVPIPHSVF